MGTFRKVELLELAGPDGQPTLEAFRPRRIRRLDSDDYAGLIPLFDFEEVVHRIQERRQLRLFSWL